jgi:alpha-N-acetylglucosamine transferase
VRLAYTTVVTSTNYLPGALALFQSIRQTESSVELVLCCTSGLLSPEFVEHLKELSISVDEIPHISNPNLVISEERFTSTYSKISIFNLTKFDKIVFLDADTLVLRNVDELFEKEHLSAVISGKSLPENCDWNHFNTGLMVIAPSASEFDRLKALASLVSSSDGGDQGFLQNVYHNWPNQSHLHLAEGFNLFIGYLEVYKKLGYHFAQPGKKDKMDISILHYWGPLKPWHFLELPPEAPEFLQVPFALWWRSFNELIEIAEDRSLTSVLRLCSDIRIQASR